MTVFSRLKFVLSIIFIVFIYFFIVNFWRQILLYFVLPILLIGLFFIFKYYFKKGVKKEEKPKVIAKSSTRRKKKSVLISKKKPKLERKLKLVTFKKKIDSFEGDVKRKKTIKTNVIASNKVHNHKKSSFRRSYSNPGYMYVQSYGEKLIAEYLYYRKIHFIYDKTMKVIDLNNSSYSDWIRPDFYLKEKGIVIEYWGMAGEEDYDFRQIRKDKIYKDCVNIKLIGIYKEDLPNLNNILKNEIEVY